MYLDRDDARSDFFLAAAVYVIGPSLYSLLRRAIGSGMPSVLDEWVLPFVVPVLLIAAMPLFLMRYRGERFKTLYAGGTADLARGALLGLIVAAGSALASLVAGNGLLAPITGNFTLVRLLIASLLRWISLAILAQFLFRRAEWAFRNISENLATLTTRAAMATVGTAVVASLLLVVRSSGQIGLVIPPLAFGAAWFAARAMVPQTGIDEQWRVYAPLIALALGPLDILQLLRDPLAFLIGAREAGMVCTFGLIGIMGLARGRGPAIMMGMAVVIAVASDVVLFLG